MRNATKRPIKDHPHLSWEALPEGVACVEIAKQVQEEVDSEAFLASLPKRLREVLELRLAGYSWAEAAQRWGSKPALCGDICPHCGRNSGLFSGMIHRNGVLNR